MGFFSELWLDLLALVWPTSCVHCGAVDRDLCAACRTEIVRGPPGAATDATERVAAGNAGETAETLEIALDSGRIVSVLAAGVYDGALRAALVALKHDGRTGFARLLGERLHVPLAEAVAIGEVQTQLAGQYGVSGPAGMAPPVIVTLPSRPAKVRERGYRHVDLMVNAALRRRSSTAPNPSVQDSPMPNSKPKISSASQTGGPGRPPRIRRLLRASRGRTGQVGLTQAAREENAARIAVRGSRSLRGLRVIVVDDIVTSGASMRAACTALEHAGAWVVAAVVVAVVRRRDASSENELEKSGLEEVRVETEDAEAIGFVKGVMVRPTEATRLTQLGGHHGSEHPRPQRRHHGSV